MKYNSSISWYLYIFAVFSLIYFLRSRYDLGWWPALGLCYALFLVWYLVDGRIRKRQEQQRAGVEESPTAVPEKP